MIDYLRLHLEDLRLRIHERGLHRRELAALARLGHITLADGRAREGRLAQLATSAAAARRRLAALAAERTEARVAARTELASAPRWTVPAVLVRGISAQGKGYRRQETAERELHELQLTAGRLAMATATNGAAREVQAIRAALANAASERARLRSALDARPVPAWLDHARREGKGLGEAIWLQLRSQLTPRLPALAGMAVGWWVTRTYTDSHARSILHSIGIGHGGTHVVSGATYKTMQFWLPLLAAAMCAYLGKRIAAALRPERA
jgi:hypothetical protein